MGACDLGSRPFGPPIIFMQKKPTRWRRGFLGEARIAVCGSHPRRGAGFFLGGVFWVVRPAAAQNVTKSAVCSRDLEGWSRPREGGAETREVCALTHLIYVILTFTCIERQAHTSHIHFIERRQTHRLTQTAHTGHHTLQCQNGASPGTHTKDEYNENSYRFRRSRTRIHCSCFRKRPTGSFPRRRRRPVHAL